SAERQRRSSRPSPDGPIFLLHPDELPERCKWPRARVRLSFQPACGSGGTGRRAGLRIQCRKASGFESRLPHVVARSARARAGRDTLHGMDIQITTKKSDGVERLLEVQVPVATVRDAEER